MIVDPRGIIKHDRNDLSPPPGQPGWMPPGYGPMYDPAFMEEETHLWDYIVRVWRRRWLVLAVLAVSLGVSVYKGLQKAPMGTATTTIKFLSEEQVTNRTEEESTTFPPLDIPTEIEIIRSRGLAEFVVRELKLFAPGDAGSTTETVPARQSAERTSSMIFEGVTPDDRVEPLSAQMEARIDAFIKLLDVRQIEGTRIVSISLPSSNPELAAKAVNTLREAYSSFTLQSLVDSQMTVRRREIIYYTNALGRARESLDESRKTLREFKARHNISVTDQSVEDMLSRIASLEEQLRAAKQELSAAELNLKQVAAFTSGSLVEDDSKVQALTGQIEGIRASLAAALTQYGENYPEVAKFRAQMKELESQLEAARTLARERLDHQHEVEVTRARQAYERAVARVQMLEESLAQLTEGLREAEAYLTELTMLEGEADAKQARVNEFVAKLQELDVSPFPKRNPIEVVDNAFPPRLEQPSLKRSLIFGGFIGLFLGVGLALFLDYMDTKVRGPAEIERLVQLPTLAYIPRFKNGYKKDEQAKNLALIAHRKPQSALAEGFRYLRTSVQYSQAETSPKTVLVTSALASEGKTTVATNLAIAYAQKGKKVLLLDADISKPAAHKVFSVDRSPGLTEILTGKLEEELGCSPLDPFRQVQVKNLVLLPSGSRVPNPIDLLDADVMRDLLVLLNEEYDKIIIDSAPILARADTSVLLPYVDGVVLVVRSGITPRAAVKRARERIVAMQGRLLGVVINNPKKDLDQSDLYGYAYGYGSGHVRDGGHSESTESDELAEPAGLTRALRGSAPSGKPDGAD